MKKRTTRITENQFRLLLDIVKQCARPPSRAGRPTRLTLEQQVRVTLISLRNNVTQEFLGEMFRVSQSTVSRTIGRLTPLLAWLLKVYVLDPEAASKGTPLLG